MTNSNTAPSANTRFASFLADTTPPEVDVCIKYHELPSFVGPLLGGPAGDAGADAATPVIGLAPPAWSAQIGTSPLSGYFRVSGGFQYDVRLVTAGAGSCSTGVAPDYVYSAPAAVNATLAATGFLAVPADAGAPPPYDAGVFDAGPDGAPVNAGLSSVALAFETFTDEIFTSTGDQVRVIHVGAWYPLPIEFVSSVRWSFTEVPYGAFGTQPPPVDPNGYANVAPPANGFGSINVNDTSGNELDGDLVFNMTANEVDTAFFVYTTAVGSVDFGILECHDSAGTTGGLWTCTTLNGG